jgi:hypothetical protein
MTYRKKIRNWLLKHPHVNPYKFSKQTITRSIPFIIFRYPLSFCRINPQFMIIGGQKCGSTSLFEYIIQHPNIQSPSQKEVHYFDANFNRNFGWYKAHFPTGIQKKIRKKEILTGEATPYYMFHPLAAERIKKLYPNMKLLIILRNPIDRAWSQFQHNKRLLREELSFEEALKMEEIRMENELKILEKDPHYKTFSLWFHSYLSMGRYYEQIKKWSKIFSKEQILIINSDELSKNTQEVMKTVFRFLNVHAYEIKNISKFNIGGYKENMSKKTREQLIDYFKIHNEDLEKYLSKELNWDR